MSDDRIRNHGRHWADAAVGTVVSVDLAYKRYTDVGIAILSPDPSGALRVRFVKAASLGLTGAPDPGRLGRALGSLCGDTQASIVLLDGPQGWKDPWNGLEHCRICEKHLNAPAKTGLPGRVKPATYAPFVHFSIAVFDEFLRCGAHLLSSDGFGSDHAGLLVLESFPLSAWRGIGIDPLPGKGTSRTRHIHDRCRRLRGLYKLEVAGDPSHDELQALVAGLAGIAYQRRERDSFQVSGIAPRIVDGGWREGFIVSPVIEPRSRAG